MVTLALHAHTIIRETARPTTAEQLSLQDAAPANKRLEATGVSQGTSTGVIVLHNQIPFHAPKRDRVVCRELSCHGPTRLSVISHEHTALYLFHHDVRLQQHHRHRQTWYTYHPGYKTQDILNPGYKTRTGERSSRRLS